MIGDQYQMRRAEELPPKIDLLPQIPHKGKQLDVAVFGPSFYLHNLNDMFKIYFHSGHFPNISFRPATTSESISIVAYKFWEIVQPIIGPEPLQVGLITLTEDGVFTNTIERDESKLKQLLNNAGKSNGIYLVDDKIAFAPRESFKEGIQEPRNFLEGGLARALEHTSGNIATKLREITPPYFSKEGVKVSGFNPENLPFLGVACLSPRIAKNELDVYVTEYVVNNGFAFGILK